MYNLEAQLRHKEDLINLIDERSKVHLIGHSIGAWMLIEILQSKPNIMKRVKSVHLLFPTLQKMADTVNGFIVNKLVRNLHYFIILFIHFLYLLPKKLVEYLIKFYGKINSLPQHHSKNILKYLNPKIVEKVMMLAYDEMDTVRNLNIEGINKIKTITNVIYGSSDGWAPISYMEELNRFLPDIKMKEVNIDHAFVLKSSETVAEMVSQNLNNNRKQEDKQHISTDL